MEAHQPRTLVLRAEPVFHHAIPDLAGRAVFRDLFEEIVMSVKEEAEARAKVVDVESAAARPLDVLNSVIQREGQFLQRGRSSFANVISADRDRIEARGKF